MRPWLLAVWALTPGMLATAALGANLGETLTPSDANPIPNTSCCEFAAKSEATFSLLSIMPRTQGAKRVLVIVVDFADVPGANTTSNSVVATMSEVDAFYRANSFQQFSLPTVDVTPVLRMPRLGTVYAGSDPLVLMEDARAAAEALGFRRDSYDFHIVTMRTIGFAWGGLGFIGGNASFIQGSVFSKSAVAHELGHNLGNRHAGAWLTSDESILGPGTHLESSNPFDVMGSGGLGHFNANFKWLTGWLTEVQIHSVSNRGTFRIRPVDTGEPVEPAARYGIRIRASPPLHSLPSDYWIDFRQQLTNNTRAMNGAILKWAADQAGPESSHLLDMNPGTVDGFKDSPLVVGYTLADMSRGIYITPVAKGGGVSDRWLDVFVDFGTPSPNAPVLDLQASSQICDPGQPVRFTASASDADGDTLAYGWDFGDETFPDENLNQPGVEKSWAVPGEYAVRCVVSDRKGKETSASLLVRVGNPNTFHVEGRVVATNRPLEGVRVHNGRTGSEYRDAWSDGNGQFFLTGLSAGSYLLGAMKPGYTLDPVFVNPASVGPASLMGFVFQAVPEGTVLITGVTPLSGYSGSSVTIHGVNLTRIPDGFVRNVLFGEVPAVFTANSAERITAVVPSGAVTAPVTVVTTRGTDTSYGSFTVLPSPPVFTIQPRSQTNGFTLNAAFHASAFGSGPLSYQWRKDGLPLASETRTNLVFAGLEASHAGAYDVIASNPIGTATSAVAVLTLIRLPTFEEMLDTPGVTWITGGVAPWITQSNVTHDAVDAAESPLLSGNSGPSWLQGSVTITEPTLAQFWYRTTPGGRLSLWSGQGTNFTQIWAAGSAQLWARGSVLLPTGSQVLRFETSSFFGQQRAWLDEVTFGLGEPPSIVSQPSDQLVGYLQPAVFSAQVTGTPPIYYRWFRRFPQYSGFNVQPISGANTPTYTIGSATQEAEFYEYAVIADNDYGSATSRWARVDVVLPPSVEIVSPADGDEVAVGTLSFQFAIQAERLIDRIDLFRNDELLGTIRPSGPGGHLSLAVTNPTPGLFQFSARVIDRFGVSRMSETIEVVAVVSLVSTGATWRYLDDGTDPGPGWAKIGFDDTAWRSGPADFGFGEGEIAPGTVVRFGDDGFNKNLTLYFRHAFSVADPTQLNNLVLRLKRDDGAVVYLNGLEVFRSNMPTGPVTRLTRATADLEGSWRDYFVQHRLEPERLLAGRNVLAVEIHLASPSVPSTAFDLALRANYPPLRPSVTILDPEPYSEVPGGQVTINAEASDVNEPIESVRFYWDFLLFGEVTAAPYSATLSNVPPGTYTFWAEATDKSGASGWSDSRQVTVPRTPFEITWIQLRSLWRYLADGSNPGPLWVTPEFEDQFWGYGTTPMGSDPGPSSLLLLDLGPPGARYPTTYFRAHFNVPWEGNFTNTILYLVGDLTDGAVAYLNGVECFRQNLPPGPVSPSSYTGFSPERFGISRTRIGAIPVHPFDNLLAVEVHQNRPDAESLIFDLALVAELRPDLPGLIIHMDDGYMELIWDGVAWQSGSLQSAPSLDGPWAFLGSGAAGSFYYVPEWPQQFFRLASEPPPLD